MATNLELKLKEGDMAPDFSAATNGGGKVTLSDFKGRNVILYFYPKDNTSGCTKEACAFRDRFAAFKKKGIVILGMSTDSVKSHDKFVQNFKLPFAFCWRMRKRKLFRRTASGVKKVFSAGNTWAHIASRF